MPARDSTRRARRHGKRVHLSSYRYLSPTTAKRKIEKEQMVTLVPVVTMNQEI